jgi:hypothetical protein
MFLQDVLKKTETPKKKTRTQECTRQTPGEAGQWGVAVEVV